MNHLNLLNLKLLFFITNRTASLRLAIFTSCGYLKYYLAIIDLEVLYLLSVGKNCYLKTLLKLHVFVQPSQHYLQQHQPAAAAIYTYVSVCVMLGAGRRRSCPNFLFFWEFLRICSFRNKETHEKTLSGRKRPSVNLKQTRPSVTSVYEVLRCENVCVYVCFYVNIYLWENKE